MRLYQFLTCNKLSQNLLTELTGKPGVLKSMGLQRVGHDWETELNSDIWNFSALMSSHVSILVKWKVFDAILYLNVHVLLIITFCQTFFLNKYRVLPLLSSPLSWLQFRPHFSQWKLHFPLVSPNPLCPHLESNAAHSLNNPLLNDHFVPSTVLGTGNKIQPIFW